MTAFIHYLEWRGPLAEAELRAAAQALSRQAGFVGAELLTDPAQNLWILESRWDRSPQVVVPEGARGWAFAVTQRFSPWPPL